MVDLVQASHVFLDCPARDVDEALHGIADKAVELGIGSDADAIFKALRSREDMGSTGMTDGYAIPHAMASEISQTAVIVLKLSGDIAWKTMDNQPVVYAIALLVPASEGASVHLELLSKIARVLTHVNFRTEMEKASDAEAIATAINKRLHD